jgi:hypothetical protein
MASMTRTRQEFIERFHAQIAGLMLFGLVDDLNGGSLARASSALHIPAKTKALLNDMYNFMLELKEAPKSARIDSSPLANGSSH